MSDYDRDRGAYSPSGEAPLAFDARQSSRGVGRPPTTLIISALILLVLVVALIFYYRSGVRGAGQPPLVGQQVGEVTGPAPASAQPAEEAEGLQIYSAEQAGAASTPAPTFAPAPEEPLPRPAPKAATAEATLPSAPAAATPAAKATAPPAPAVKAATPAPTAGGGSLVQIGALSSPALADKAWSDVAKLLPGEMAGRTKRVEPVTTEGGTLYRAYIGGFDSRAEAASFCDQLKAAGKSCIVR